MLGACRGCRDLISESEFESNGMDGWGRKGYVTDVDAVGGTMDKVYGMDKID